MLCLEIGMMCLINFITSRCDGVNTSQVKFLCSLSLITLTPTWRLLSDGVKISQVNYTEGNSLISFDVSSCDGVETSKVYSSV